MAEQLINYVESTINMVAGLSSSATSITVADGSVFPSSGNFRIGVDDEIMICTGRAANVLTVTRGAESTTATAHANGSIVAGTATAGGVVQYVTEQVSGGGGGSAQFVQVTGADQSGVTNGADFDVAWNSTDFDTNSFWNGANPTRLTVPTGLGGNFLIQAQCTLLFNSTGYFNVKLVNQSGVVLMQSRVWGTDANAHGISGRIDGVFALSAGNWVKLVVDNETGSSGVVLCSFRQTMMYMMRLR